MKVFPGYAFKNVLERLAEQSSALVFSQIQNNEILKTLFTHKKIEKRKNERRKNGDLNVSKWKKHFPFQLQHFSTDIQ